jgi:hypothetical protein
MVKQRGNKFRNAALGSLLVLALASAPASANHEPDIIGPAIAFITLGALLHHGHHNNHGHGHGHKRHHNNHYRSRSHGHGGYGNGYRHGKKTGGHDNHKRRYSKNHGGGHNSHRKHYSN